MCAARSIAAGLLVALLSILGCANPSIVKLSPDTYLLIKEDHAGIFGSMAKLKASVIEEANQFAASQGKVAIPLQTNEKSMGPGRFAYFEYQFRVVAPDDPEAKRTALRPDADVRIEQKTDAKIEHTENRSSDVYTELTKLDDLRKRGIITDAEFEAEKAKILSRE